MHSLIAVEIVLRDRITDAGTKPLFQLIKQGVEAGVLTARQAEYLDYGRKTRNAWRTVRPPTRRCRRPWRCRW
ncbi:hypothetical protein ACLGI4_28685 [Streptomyces sp. HMX112]|uniref:hypothetical protein n=1 Tax=Streptomyces sp. HMX112 TaxID=3390850 RepID=UPI003A7F7042